MPYLMDIAVNPVEELMWELSKVSPFVILAVIAVAAVAAVLIIKAVKKNKGDKR